MELHKPDVHQIKGMWNVSMCGRGPNNVCIGNSRVVRKQPLDATGTLNGTKRGTLSGEPTVGTRGLRKVRAEGDGDGIGQADGGLMLPVVLRPATGEHQCQAGHPSGCQSTIGCASRQGC